MTGEESWRNDWLIINMTVALTKGPISKSWETFGLYFAVKARGQPLLLFRGLTSKSRKWCCPWMVISLPSFPTRADQQHIILIFEPPLRGQRLASEVGWAATSGAKLETWDCPSNADDTFESCSGREVLALRICETCRGWPDFSCCATIRSFSIRCECRVD